MCGRYTHRHTWPEIVALYRLTQPAVAPNDFGPRYNIAPTQRALVVRERDGKREAAMLRWGLIPFWAKDAKIAYKTINARSETVATAPSFRAAWKSRRCLIPTSGFYEWAKTAGGKQPYLIGFKDRRPFLVRGAMGELEGQGKRRDGRELHHHHRRAQCSRWENSQPHAGHHRPG